MNLIQKTITFVSLYSKGLKSAAWLTFKQPLTDSDKCGLVIIACIALIVTVLRHADAIDSYNVSLLQVNRNIALQRDYAIIDSTKYQKIIISMLNGEFIENGSRKTICVLNAAGDCR